MGLGLNTGLSFLAFFIVIGPLILLHELGHFLAARANGVTVEEFGIGFPPRMITLFEQGGTKFTLNWLPLGGFMRPAGEDDPNVPGGLANAPKRARFAVLAAGPGANFLVAFVLLFTMFLIGAPEVQPGAELITIEPGSPAETAGLREGDIIMEADGVSVMGYNDLISKIHDNLGEPILLTVQRGGSLIETTLTPRTEWPEGQGPTGIQVQSVIEVKKYGPIAAAGKTFEEFGSLLRAFIEVPAAVIQNQIPARYLRPVSIVGISQLGGQALSASIDENAAWPIVQLTAFISLALAISNLLPLPALDGGRILFVFLEAIRGRRVDPQREMVIHFVGFAVLLAAMLIFVYLDLVDPLIQ